MATAGLKIVLPGTFTDSSLPQLYDDSILSSGSLALIDLAHSANPLASGVPADGASIPNIAWKQAAAILGSGTQSSLAGTFNRLNAFAAGAGSPRGVFERTPKGGLHCAVARSTTIAANDGARIQMASAIATYLIANPTHSFYSSIWDCYTRVNDGSGVPSYQYGVGGSGALSGFTTYQGDSGAATNGGKQIGARATALNTVGPAQKTQAVTGANGTPGSADNGVFWGAPPSGINYALLATRNQHWPSWVLYRFYVEDLTVSGRSYATVDALDLAAYTRDVLTSGGRYNGDTYTAAATLIA